MSKSKASSIFSSEILNEYQVQKLNLTKKLIQTDQAFEIVQKKQRSEQNSLNSFRFIERNSSNNNLNQQNFQSDKQQENNLSQKSLNSNKINLNNVENVTSQETPKQQEIILNDQFFFSSKSNQVATERTQNFSSARSLEQGNNLNDLKYFIKKQKDLENYFDQFKNQQNTIISFKDQLKRIKISLGSCNNLLDFDQVSCIFFQLDVAHSCLQQTINKIQEAIENNYQFLNFKNKVDQSFVLKQDELGQEDMDPDLYFTFSEEAVEEYEEAQRVLKFLKISNDNMEKIKNQQQHIQELYINLNKYMGTFKYFLKQKILQKEKLIHYYIKEQKSILSEYLQVKNQQENDIKTLIKLKFFHNERILAIEQKIDEKIGKNENDPEVSNIFLQNIVLKEIRITKMMLNQAFFSIEDSLFVNINNFIYNDTLQKLKYLKQTVKVFIQDFEWVQSNFKSIKQQVLDFISQEYYISQKLQEFFSKEINGKSLQELQTWIYKSNSLLSELVQLKNDLQEKQTKLPSFLACIFDQEIQKITVLILNIQNFQEKSIHQIDQYFDVYQNSSLYNQINYNQSQIEDNMYLIMEQFKQKKSIKVSNLQVVKKCIMQNDIQIKKLDNPVTFQQKSDEFSGLINNLIFICESIEYFDQENKIQDVSYFQSVKEILNQITNKIGLIDPDCIQITLKQLFICFTTLIKSISIVNQIVIQQNLQSNDEIKNIIQQINNQEDPLLMHFSNIYDNFKQNVLIFLDKQLNQN